MMENGKMDLKWDGTYVYINGDVYKGNWKNGKMHGNGIFEYANGNKYEGNYEKW